MTKKVLIWLSGWVDSAVSAYLLKQAGYDVIAGFMINYLAPKWEYCPTLEDIKVAREVAKYLDIPFLTFDFRDTYEEKVLNYMYEWYKKWITPNPDIMCNSEVKFKVFLDEALDMWFDKVAMWHYAQIENIGSSYLLKKWVDETKDQSYFLAGLSPYQLSRAIFPIWSMKKSEVRKLRREIWLPNRERPDSQGICFVGNVDMTKFLEKKIDHKIWDIIDTSWKKLWTHKWVFYYTIGQRKWLDIWWLKKPIFVIKKDIVNNILIVWTEDDLKLYSDTLEMQSINYLKKDLTLPLNWQAKIRYRQKDQPCRVLDIWNNKLKVEFKTPQRAIARGQICAIYSNDDILLLSGVMM